MVERDLAKVEVAGSSPVVRSITVESPGFDAPCWIVRHGPPDTSAGGAPPSWPLHPDAVPLIKALASQLVAKEIRDVVASDEPKAVDTARIVADALGREFRVDARAREVARPFVSGDLAHSVSRYLRGDVLEEWEPLDSVVARLDEILFAARGTVVVTHGTALSAWLARRAELDSVALWSSLQFPDLIELSGS